MNIKTLLKSCLPLFFAFCMLGNSLTSFASSLEDTIITGDRLEVETKQEGHQFHFYGNVKVQTKELLVHCDELEVIAEPKVEAGMPCEATPALQAPAVGAISLIIARGHVEVTQGERQAKAGLAEIFSKENKIILSDNPVVTDPEGQVKGYRIILYQDKEGIQRVSVEGDPTCPSERPSIVLPNSPELKPSKAQKIEPSSPQATPTQEATENAKRTSPEASTHSTQDTP